MSILLSLQAVGSQAADQMPDLTAVTLPTEAEINVIDLAFKGGWIMVVLLLLSLMAIYIFVQRLIALPPVVVSGLPNMTPIFSRNWLMKMQVVLVLLMVEVSLRRA